VFIKLNQKGCSYSSCSTEGTRLNEKFFLVNFRYEIKLFVGESRAERARNRARLKHDCTAIVTVQSRL
jgi:hypothetical protein